MLAFQAVDDAKPYLLPASAVQIRLLHTVLIVGSTAKKLAHTPDFGTRKRFVVASVPTPLGGLALLRG